MHLLSVVSCVLFFLNDDCSLSDSLISSTGPDGLSSQLVTQPELTERLEAAADNLQQQQEQQLASSMERVRTEVLAQLAAQHHAHQQVVQCFLYGTLELLLLSVSELICRLYFLLKKIFIRKLTEVINSGAERLDFCSQFFKMFA